MGRVNKAHTATANRIAERYRTNFNPHDGPDIEVDGLVIEVETTATLDDAVARLKRIKGRATYIALTNKEGVSMGVTAVRGTPVGVMDPDGEIIVEAGGG